MRDQANRTIDYMRISITDRCNFRCTYCMPEEGIACLANEEVLTFEEIIKIVVAGSELGIKKIKLTGGEPLVRKELVALVAAIHQVPGIERISLTTNGLLLKKQLPALVAAGLTDVNISLDTLDREKFKQLTSVDGLACVLEALRAAAQSGLKSVKVNVVPIKGFNEEEIVALAALARDAAVHVRFIELMPIGLGVQKEGITQVALHSVLETVYGTPIPFNKALGNGPAKYWQLPAFIGKIGYISAVSECFCEDCNRIRITAGGYLKTCLHATTGIDLKYLLRAGGTKADLMNSIRGAVEKKPIKHQFGKIDATNREQKMMVQIGG